MCQITEGCVSDLCYVIYATPKNHYKCVSACNVQRLEATRGIECTDRTHINAPTVQFSSDVHSAGRASRCWPDV